MSEHFIKEIEIKDYKLFKDFKANGFGRVNLIGGKNNVGKTAFLEACYVHTQQSSHAIFDIIFSRYYVEFLEQLMSDVGIRYILNIVQDKSQIFQDTVIKSNIETKVPHYNEKEISTSKKKKNIVFMDTSKYTSSILIEWYSKIIELGMEDMVDELIKKFDQNIEKFRIINTEPKCFHKNFQKFYNLNEFGDGLSKYVGFVSLLLAIERGIVFIDEIENGIHYTNFDKLWEIILEISKKQNIQVFATTHSKECIESYARVSKKQQDDEITFIELGKNKQSQIRAIVMDSERFYRELDSENEVRGW